MKKLLCVTIALLCTATMQAQEEEKDVTKFLGIPVDGYKPAMIEKLKAKGFRSIPNADLLEGEFNGTDVLLSIVTNNNKVWRIMLTDKNFTRNVTDIKIRFNQLCKQFENNPKYIRANKFDSIVLGRPELEEEPTIPDNEDLSCEITLKDKRYEAAYYQLPDSVTKEQILVFPTDILVFPTDTIEEGSVEKILERAATLRKYIELNNKSVWYMISQQYGRYRIIMYYDNEYNHANGEDL